MVKAALLAAAITVLATTLPLRADGGRATRAYLHAVAAACASGTDEETPEDLANDFTRIARELNEIPRCGVVPETAAAGRELQALAGDLAGLLRRAALHRAATAIRPGSLSRRWSAAWSASRSRCVPKSRRPRPICGTTCGRPPSVGNNAAGNCRQPRGSSTSMPADIRRVSGGGPPGRRSQRRPLPGQGAGRGGRCGGSHHRLHPANPHQTEGSGGPPAARGRPGKPESLERCGRRPHRGLAPRSGLCVCRRPAGPGPCSQWRVP